MQHQKLPEASDDGYEGVIGDQHQNTCYQSCLICCGNLGGCLKIWCPCICCCCQSPLYQLQTAKTGILQSFGRFKKVFQPGFHIINPLTEKVLVVDMKTNVMNLAPQQIITKDNVTLKIQTVVYYRTVNPVKLVYKLGNNFQQIRTFITELSYNALRNVAGIHTFQELVQERAKIADSLQSNVSTQLSAWGLFIQNIFIKDLILSEQTKKNLQSAAIQKRVSEANIISAKADVESAKMLKETSEILNSSSAMQIRYLQAVQQIINATGQKSMFVNLKVKQ